MDQNLFSGFHVYFIYAIYIFFLKKLFLSPYTILDYEFIFLIYTGSRE